MAYWVSIRSESQLSRCVNDSVIVQEARYITDRVRAMFIPKIFIYTLTAARIWQNADKEYKENNPKMERHANLRVLMYCFVLCLHPHACVLLAPCRQSVVVCGVHLLSARVLPSCFRSLQSRDSQLSSPQKFNIRSPSLCCMTQHRP